MMYWTSLRHFLTVLAGCWLLVGQSAVAHTVRPAVVDLVWADSGEVRIVVRTNAEVLLADISADYADTNDAPNAAVYDAKRALPSDALAGEFDEFAPQFVERLRLEVDGAPAELSYAGIRVEDEPDFELARTSYIELRTVLSPGAQQMVWHWPDEYGSNVLRIQKFGDENISSAWLKRGEVSPPYPLTGEVAARSSFAVGLDYVVIGFEHILPKGLDHILFVFGIFLLSIHWRPLLLQVTAFTLAHTITLGMSIYGLISAPASIVEPLIALSIAYVGIENCLASKLKPWRIILVFCFGLLHGMGFAGVLSEIGLPQSEFLLALITFNVGVELGQLTVILLAFLALGWWRNESWYRQRVTIPLSLLIAAVGLYWTVERVIG